MTNEALPEVAEETVERDALDAILARDTRDDDTQERDDLPEVTPEPTPTPTPVAAKVDAQPKKNENADAAKAAQAERYRRKQYQEQVETLQRELKQYKDREAQAQQPKPPSFDDDPAAALKHQTEMLNKQHQEMQERIAQMQRAESVRTFEAHARQAVSNIESQFVQQNADYYDALNHVRNVERTRMNYFPDEHIDGMLQSVGINPAAVPDKATKINELVKRQEWNAAVQMLNNGLNPADYIYNLAKSFGYQQQLATKQLTQPAQPDRDATEAIERAKAGQRLSRGGVSAHVGEQEESGVDPDIFSVLSDLRKNR